MTIQIELSREMEQVLDARARSEGMPVERYAQRVLQRALGDNPVVPKRASLEEFRAFLEGMAASSEGTRLTAGEIFDRDFIYGEHA